MQLQNACAATLSANQSISGSIHRVFPYLVQNIFQRHGRAKINLRAAIFGWNAVLA
jgi:hypothetical protein